MAARVSGNGPGLPIAANTTYQIPNDPITIRGNQDKLRLVIEPAAQAGGHSSTGHWVAD